ncbi:hypothetical protein HWV62_19235 [Athelia sp. TMB]|nr:hypothetical protein HWV62_19235 [Athelia sp. TMB]
MPQEGNESGEWQYFTVREGYGQEMLDLGRQDNAKELLILSAEDVPALCNHPRGYLTGDIFYSHPTRPNYFKHAGRKTGMTILSNGEKVDNQQIQSILLQDKRIAHAAVFGNGRFQIGVLLQPASADDAGALVDEVWHIIKHINQIVPGHARIVRPLVLTTKEDRGFSLTAKGTVKEWETLEAYAPEIEEAYATLESRGTYVDFPEAWDQATVTQYIREVVAKATGSRIADDVDFFIAGMDSLQVGIVRAGCNALLAHFEKTNTISSADVYSNPTIASLAQTALSHNAAAAAVSVEDAVQAIVERYDACGPRPPAQEPASRAEVVVLTGATGSLGAFLLHALLQNAAVARVYCLHRAHAFATPQERQAAVFARKGLDAAALADPRLTFACVDLAQADLGLEPGLYAEIQARVTRIIHCAWELDFNRALRSFAVPHIAGVRHLADLAMGSARYPCPRLVFVSSIAACAQAAPGSVIPEEFVDLPPPAAGGYGQSKYAAEKLLIALQKQGGLNVSIIRAGQLSGASTNGAWAASEYMPVIFKTSHALELFPSDLRPVRWLPVDLAAQAVAAQAFAYNGRLEYFNLAGAAATPWGAVTALVLRLLQHAVRPVPMRAWLAAARAQLGADCPAMRLAPFLAGLAEGAGGGEDAVLDVARSARLCPALACGPVTLELLAAYLAGLGIPVSDAA